MPAQWILVLGRHITSEYNQRLDRAIALATKNSRSRILVLGGKPRDTRLSEARYGRDYLISKGIEQHRIVVEEESRHTLENMLHARDMLQQGQKVILVSSRSHLARAHGLADSLGIEHEVCAAEPEASLKPLALLNMMLEAYYLNWIWAARLWARMTGRTGHVGPVQ